MARYGQECGNGLKIAVASFIKVSLVGNLNFCQETRQGAGYIPLCDILARACGVSAVVVRA